MAIVIGASLVVVAATATLVIPAALDFNEMEYLFTVSLPLSLSLSWFVFQPLSLVATFATFRAMEMPVNRTLPGGRNPAPCPGRRGGARPEALQSASTRGQETMAGPGDSAHDPVAESRPRMSVPMESARDGDEEPT